MWSVPNCNCLCLERRKFLFLSEDYLFPFHYGIRGFSMSQTMVGCFLDIDTIHRVDGKILQKINENVIHVLKYSLEFAGIDLFLTLI